MSQESLNFDSHHAREAVRTVLSEHWLANHELPKAVFAVTGKWYSETGLSARVRDLKKPQYGGWTVSRRRPEGKSYMEYRVIA